MWGIRSTKPSCFPILGVASALLILSGCASAPGYAPRSAFSLEKDIGELHQEFDTAASIKNYYDTGAETVEKRNKFIAGRLVLYDLEYMRFIARFRLSQAQASTAFDSVALGLGFATSIAGGAHTKSVLGAVTTALTGLRTSYEKNFFEDKTTAALVAQMTAGRKAALVPIIAGTKAPITEYPLTTAIVDLSNYEMAGTIDGALVGIQSDAAAKDAQATAKLDQYRAFSFKPDDSTARIQKWIWPGLSAFDPDGTPRDSAGKAITADQTHYQQLKAELKTLKLDGIAVEAFLDNGSLADARASAIKDLAIP